MKKIFILVMFLLGAVMQVKAMTLEVGKNGRMTLHTDTGPIDIQAVTDGYSWTVRSEKGSPRVSNLQASPAVTPTRRIFTDDDFVYTSDPALEFELKK